MSLTSSLNLSAFGVPRIENTRPRFPHHDLRPRRALRRSSVQLMSGADYNRSPKTLRATVFTQTDPMPYGPRHAYESAYVYGGNSPLVYTDPSGLRKTAGKCNTSIARQAGAFIVALNPFGGQSYCEAVAVNKALRPVSIAGSTLAAGSCGAVVGLTTLNPQWAGGAAGACGGAANAVTGGGSVYDGAANGYAEGYSVTPPGVGPIAPASSGGNEVLRDLDAGLTARIRQAAGFNNGPALIVDESLNVPGGPAKVAAELRAAGYNARAVREFAPASRSDANILGVADAIDARVIAVDRGRQLAGGFGERTIQIPPQVRTVDDVIRILKAAGQ